jgi:hypothetical protein
MKYGIFTEEDLHTIVLYAWIHFTLLIGTIFCGRMPRERSNGILRMDVARSRRKIILF